MSRRRDLRSAERGASAVEFGLVAPLLITLVLGMLQYGLYFYDALGTRDGVREAARRAVVAKVPACGGQQGWSRLSCYTRTQIDAVTGPTYVKVLGPTSWGRGERLVVCAMVASDGAIGLFPLPNDGWIRSRTEMSIETSTALSGTPGSDSVPAGADWAWCT